MGERNSYAARRRPRPPCGGVALSRHACCSQEGNTRPKRQRRRQMRIVWSVEEHRYTYSGDTGAVSWHTVVEWNTALFQLNTLSNARLQAHAMPDNVPANRLGLLYPKLDDEASCEGWSFAFGPEE